MNIKILAFGIAKDIVGGRALDFSIAQTSTVGQLKNALLEKYPKFENLSSLAIAINNEYAENDYLIQENDEIVLIPPVSGG